MTVAYWFSSLFTKAAEDNLVGANMKSGFYHGPNAPIGTATAFTQSSLFATPFIVARGATIDRIGVNCTVVAASSAVRLGIYRDNGGTPGALVLDAGTVDTTTGTGTKEITISKALTPGVYWLAAVSQGGAPTLSSYAQNHGLHVPGSTFAATNRLGISRTSVTAALPDPFGGTPVIASTTPFVLVRAA